MQKSSRTKRSSTSTTRAVEMPWSKVHSMTRELCLNWTHGDGQQQPCPTQILPVESKLSNELFPASVKAIEMPAAPYDALRIQQICKVFKKCFREQHRILQRHLKDSATQGNSTNQPFSSILKTTCPIMSMLSWRMKLNTGQSAFLSLCRIMDYDLTTVKNNHGSPKAFPLKMK